MRDARRASRRPASPAHTARRVAVAAGSVAVGGLALMATCAGPAFADTAPAPLPSTSTVLASPSPDVTGTLTSVTTTTTSTLQTAASATPTPQPSSVPTSVPTTTTSGGGKTQQGGRTGAVSGVVDSVRHALHRAAPAPARSTHRSPAGRAPALVTPALPDLPVLHGWGGVPPQLARTPVVAPFAPLPAAPAPSASLAQRALDGLAATSSPFRRILTIAATMILGLIGAGHLKSAQIRSRSGSSG